MNMITRTVVTTIIKAAKVAIVDGKPTLTPVKDVTVFNRSIADNPAALKEVQKVYTDKEQYVVTEIVKDEQVYGVTFEEFMKSAVKIERTKKADEPETAKPEPPKPPVTTSATAPVRPFGA